MSALASTAVWDRKAPAIEQATVVFSREFRAHKNTRGKAEQAIAPVLSGWSPCLTLPASQVTGVGTAREAAGQKSTWLLVAIFVPWVDEQGADFVPRWHWAYSGLRW